MQPCSVAWTVGQVIAGPGVASWGGVDHNTGKSRTPPYQQVWKKKVGVKTAAECREWADTVMKWPTAAVLEFEGLNMPGGYWPGSAQQTTCRVWAMPDLPFLKSKFGLQLRGGGNRAVSCWLGNPEEYKERLANEKALGHTIDKCSKTSLWSAGIPQYNVLGAQMRDRYPSGITYRQAGQLMSPDPTGYTQEGRKLCLKWAKKDPKCANATLLYLKSTTGACVCYDSVWQVKQITQPHVEPAHPTLRTGNTYQVCQFQQ